MKLCFLECWSYFVESNISPHLIFLTSGELGMSKESNLTPNENGALREQEAIRAAHFLGATITFLNFPDLRLPFVQFEKLVTAVLMEIQSHESDALFSFHPHEISPLFDHLDHNLAGMVARHAGAAADVRHFLPDEAQQQPATLQKVLEKRPELYLWTSSDALANTRLPLQEKTRQKRNKYLIENYPSQFSESKKETWIPIFDSITKKNGKHKRKAPSSSKNNHVESYFRVR